MRREHLVGIGDIIGAALVAGVVAAIGLAAIDRVHWPAFNSSNVSTALTTTGQVAGIAILIVAVLCHRSRFRSSRRLIGRAVKPLSWLGMSVIATVTLAMPLGGSKLYLFGISIDQQFRTEYLTRFTDSPALADMTYAGLPPYYPAGWFWFGGRYANLVGQPAWEAFKPWSILTIAVAAAVATALWTRLMPTDRAIAVSLATTLLTIMYAGPEPYGAVLILVGVPMLVTLFHGLRSGSMPAIIASGLMIGVSGACYTLFTGLFAMIAVLMTAWLALGAWRAQANPAVVSADIRRARTVALLRLGARLVVTGVIAGLVCLTVWAPYLWARLSGPPSSGGAAEHYLPAGGASLPLPMLHWSLIGALSMIGLIWLILRFQKRTVATALGISVIGIYLFALLSMAVTAIGTTLLAFRLEPVLVVILAAAGIYGVAELASAAVERLGDIRTLIGVLGAVAAIAVAQSIPSHLSGEISLAYTDTDGNGVRADQRPPGAEAYFPQINGLIHDQTHAPANRSIVLTADYGFLSIYPYWGFQGLTSHYANPLSEFDKRAATIADWAGLNSPNELLDAMDRSPWPAPNVFLFRQSPEGYTLRLARDVYPNDPNVQRYTVTFSPSLFDDPRFRVTDIGPFALVVRVGEQYLRR